MPICERYMKKRHVKRPNYRVAESMDTERARETIRLSLKKKSKQKPLRITNEFIGADSQLDLSSHS